MPAIKKEEIEHVAELANLPLAQSEKETYASQLAKIVTYVQKLQEVSTEDVSPTAQVTGLTDVYRPDRVDSERVLPKDKALANAPREENDQFAVEAIFKR